MIILSSCPNAAPMKGAEVSSIQATGSDTASGAGTRSEDGPPVHGFGEVFGGVLRGALAPGSEGADPETTAEPVPDVEEAAGEEDGGETDENAIPPVPEMTVPAQPATGSAPEETAEPRETTERASVLAAPGTVAKGGDRQAAAGPGPSARGKADVPGAGGGARAASGAVADKSLPSASSGAKPAIPHAVSGDASLSGVAEGRSAMQDRPSPIGNSAAFSAPRMRADRNLSGNSAHAPEWINRMAALGETVPAARGFAAMQPTPDSGALADAMPWGKGLSQGVAAQQFDPGRVQDTPPPVPHGRDTNRAPTIAITPPATPENAGAISPDPVGVDTPQAVDVARADRPGPAPASGQPVQGAPTPVARSVTPQIAAAVHASGERSVEIVLSPAELGKVRITLSPGEGAMTVNIVADRPETLDLLRRHSDLLAQDFHDLGYEGTAFSFARGDGAQGRDNEPVTAATPAELVGDTTAEDTVVHALHPHHPRGDDRIDIRL